MTLNLNMVIVILILVFIASNVYVEWVNRVALPWNQNPLSAYLTGVKDAWVQTVGYLLFALNLLIVAAAFGGFWYWLLLGIGSAALFMVVLTKDLIAHPAIPAPNESILERAHVISAGVAFITTTAALALYSWQHHLQVAFALAVLVPISALLFWMFEPDETVLEEKSATAFLLASLLAVFLPRLWV